MQSRSFPRRPHGFLRVERPAGALRHTPAAAKPSRSDGRVSERRSVMRKGKPNGGRLRRLAATGALIVCCATPGTLRPLVQLLANSAAYAQRAEAVAQAAIRADTLSHLFRRS